MLVEIQEAIAKAIKEGLENALQKVAAGRDLKFASPSVSVFIDNGKLGKRTEESLVWDVAPVVQVKFKDVSSDEARRKGVYRIVEGIVALLTGKTFDLGISPLEPTQYANVTNNDDESGSIVFQLAFKSIFTTTIPDEEEESAEDLLSIGVAMYLRGLDDGEPDVEAEIDLTDQGGN